MDERIFDDELMRRVHQRQRKKKKLPKWQRMLRKYWPPIRLGLLCLVLVIRKKERPGFREFFYGTLIGIPNFFSAKFLLASLGSLPAVVVYPSFSVGTLLIVTLVGVLLFRERLRKAQWIALAAILAALILLNI